MLPKHDCQHSQCFLPEGPAGIQANNVLVHVQPELVQPIKTMGPTMCPLETLKTIVNEKSQVLRLRTKIRLKTMGNGLYSKVVKTVSTVDGDNWPHAPKHSKQLHATMNGYQLPEESVLDVHGGRLIL